MGGFGLRIPERKGGAAGGVGRAQARATGLFEDGDAHADLPPAKKATMMPGAPARAAADAAAQEALAEDPSAFDYDEVYDRVSSAAAGRAKLQAQARDASPRYMPAILEAAERRRREMEGARVRRFRRESEREKDPSTADGGPKTEETVFVTAGYKRKLAEMQARGISVDAPGADAEADEDPPQSRDMARFYGNLLRRNVSFGARGPPRNTQ